MKREKLSIRKKTLRTQCPAMYSYFLAPFRINFLNSLLRRPFRKHRTLTMTMTMTMSFIRNSRIAE